MKWFRGTCRRCKADNSLLVRKYSLCKYCNRIKAKERNRRKKDKRRR
jgi:hypothetical protein